MTTPSTVAAPESSSLPLRPSAATTDVLPSPAKPPGTGEGLTTDEAGVRPSPPASLTTNGAASASSAPAAPLNLYKKLALISKAVAIRGTGRTAQGQRTMSIADVEQALGDLLAEHGIVTDYHWNGETKIAASQGNAHLWLADITIRLVNSDNPDDRREARSIDVGTSPSAAVSFALKRFYRALFHLADEEDETRSAGSTKTAANTAAADKAAVNHLTPEQLEELDRLNKTLAIPVASGLPWNSLVAGRPFDKIKTILEARRENGKA